MIAQGEPIFRELVNCIDRPEVWPSITGLCISVDGKPCRTGTRPMVRMDDLPPARYDLLDVENYFRHKGRRQIDYSSSRGCPYKCTFCADPMVYNSKWTGISADRVVRELSGLHERYRMDEVLFLDDDLFCRSETNPKPSPTRSSPRRSLSPGKARRAPTGIMPFTGGVLSETPRRPAA